MNNRVTACLLPQSMPQNDGCFGDFHDCQIFVERFCFTMVFFVLSLSRRQSQSFPFMYFSLPKFVMDGDQFLLFCRFLEDYWVSYFGLLVRFAEFLVIASALHCTSGGIFSSAILIGSQVPFLRLKILTERSDFKGECSFLLDCHVFQYLCNPVLSVFELLLVLISVRFYVYGAHFVKLSIINAAIFNVFGLISVLVVFSVCCISFVSGFDLCCAVICAY